MVVVIFVEKYVVIVIVIVVIIVVIADVISIRSLQETNDMEKTHTCIHVVVLISLTVAAIVVGMCIDRGRWIVLDFVDNMYVSRGDVSCSIGRSIRV